MAFFPELYKTYCIVGSRASGKTVIAKNMITTKNRLSEGVQSWHIFTNGVSAEQYDFLVSKKSQHRVHLTLDTEKIQQLLDLNEKRKLKGKHLINFGLVFDDCLDKTSGNHPVIQKLFTQGRHYKFSILYLTQSVSMGLPPTVRRNCDAWFVLRPRIAKDIKFYWEELLSVDYSREEAQALFARLQPYQALIISFQNSGTLELFIVKSHH